MSHALSEKSFECLLFIGGNKRDRSYRDWQNRWNRLCDRWGNKQAIRTLESLCRRGYIDYGVNVCFGWPTEKGIWKVIEYMEVTWGNPQIPPQPVENTDSDEFIPGLDYEPGADDEYLYRPGV